MRTVCVAWSCILACWGCFVGFDGGAVHCAAADDAKPAATPAGVGRRHVVQITEFRLPVAAKAELKSDELLRLYEKLTADGQLDVVEVVRLSALEGHETMAQFGRRTGVTVGVNTAPGRGPGGSPLVARQYQQQSVGTLVRLTISDLDGRLALDLSYESSKLDGKGAEDTPPEIANVQFKSRLHVTPGKPEFLGGSSAGAATWLVLTLE